ncbi:MAG: DUF3575 domain-containing protein [Prevotellaceae bacterium]|nr:DUF3575 domain-containing protein [Prevotellaceae bacterium]
MSKVATRCPVLSIKTNMLYDLALTPNIAAEIGIGRKWSVSAGFMCGWWLSRDWSFCWQAEAAEVEVRYWLGRSEYRPALTGWFVGTFAASGFYDFQLKRTEGVQGKLKFTGGISGGYAYRLGQRWRLELLLGVGYLLSDYHRYTVAQNGDKLVLLNSGSAKRLKAFFPLKAGVSLAWIINTNRT